MGYQFTALVVVFLIAEVTCDECEYRRLVPPDVPHIGCIPRNPDCNIIDDSVTDEEKSLILDLHNRIRENITLGRETKRPQLPGMPTASNMMEMVWDDELAELAQRRAETCKFHYDCYECLRVERFPVGQILFRVWQERTEGIWKKMMNQFYREISHFKRKYVSSYKLGKHFAEVSQILWAQTWRVGCGKATFIDGKLNKTHVACHYGPRGNFENHPMYWIGNPCSDCPEKTYCGDSSRYKGLCQAEDGFETTFHDLSPEDVSKLEDKDSKVIMCRVTGTSPKGPKSKVSSKNKNSLTCRFSTSREWPLLDYVPSTELKTCKYEKFTSKHIGCKKKNPSCKFVNNKITKEERREIMKWLNRYRDDVASGKVIVGDKIFPPAANMNKLYWDNELAMLAQRHAETCNPDVNADCPECRQTDRFNVGQIIYTSNSTDFPRQYEKMVPDSIKIPIYLYEITWAEALRVGCGKVVVKEGNLDFKTMIACYFGPGANLTGFTNLEEAPTPYISGFVDDDGINHACYICPDDFCCGSFCEDYDIHTDFTALCQSSRLEIVIPYKGACEYERFTSEHVGCKPKNPRCRINDTSRVTAKERIFVTRLFNKYRDEVAWGRGRFRSKRLPAATNMNKLYWDIELAMLAQRHAETCDKNLNVGCPECRETDRFNVGQIVYTARSSTFPRLWVEMLNSTKHTLKNFVQLTWAFTFRIGCGLVLLDEESIKVFKFYTMIVCYFAPGVIVPYDDPDEEAPGHYKTYKGVLRGKNFYPCSKCPYGFCCGPLCEDYGIPNDKTALCRSISIETQTQSEESKSIETQGFFAFLKCRMWTELGVHHLNYPERDKRHYKIMCRSSRPEGGQYHNRHLQVLKNLHTFKDLIYEDPGKP